MLKKRLLLITAMAAAIVLAACNSSSGGSSRIPATPTPYETQIGRFELLAGSEEDGLVTGNGFVSADGRHLIMTADLGDQSGKAGGGPAAFGGIVMFFGTLID